MAQTSGRAEFDSKSATLYLFFTGIIIYLIYKLNLSDDGWKV